MQGRGNVGSAKLSIMFSEADGKYLLKNYDVVVLAAASFFWLRYGAGICLEKNMFKDFDAITVGDTHALLKKISVADVRKFVDRTGDDPQNLGRTYAETTSYIPTVIGVKLSGVGALWVAQNIAFLLQVRLGDIRCTELKKYDQARLLELDSRTVNQNQQFVLSGNWTVRVLATAAPGVSVTPVGCLKVATIVSGAAATINSAEGWYEIAVQTDIAIEEGAPQPFEAACRVFGGLSVWVKNATPRIHPKLLVASSWSDVQQLGVQVKSTYLMTKACVSAAIERCSGRVINIISQVPQGTPLVSWNGYAMDKDTLDVFSRWVAGKLGSQAISVDCMASGMCGTTQIGYIPEKAQPMIRYQTPLRRLAKLADVAAVGLLVSNGVAFVTGNKLAVNGGMAMR